MARDVALTLGVAPGAFAFTSNVTNDDTVVIGDTTYTFQASPAAAFDVDVGSDLDDSITKLVAAINLGGTAGTDYHADTTRNPYVTAAADTTNDELDLTARVAGAWVNGLHLAATSPGANSITADAAAFGLCDETGQVDGIGNLRGWLDGLLNLNQINAEVIRHLSDAIEGTS